MEEVVGVIYGRLNRSEERAEGGLVGIDEEEQFLRAAGNLEF